MRRLDRYIIREILGPLGLGFLVYTFILLLNFLFQSAEMIIRRGLPVSVVLELLALTLPNILVLTIPMALLFGTLIAVGRLSADSELIALRSCGVSLLSLYRPILIISGLLGGMNLLLMLYALPWGNHGLQQLRLDIVTRSVAKQVQPRIFYEEWEGTVIYVFEMPPGEERWKGVFVADSLPSTTENQVTAAEWGRVRVDAAGERVVLELENAVTHTVNLNNPDDYEITRHEKLERVLDDGFATQQREKISMSKSLRELTLGELREKLREPQITAEMRNLAQVEIHKKFAIPLACLVFGLIALPLGFNNRRGGKASGFALSVGVIMLYYILLNNGEETARYGNMSPWLAMWLPNLLLGVVGIILLLRRNRDKSLLLTRLDRWVRGELWSGILRLQRRLELRRRHQRLAVRQRMRERAQEGVSRWRMVLPRVRFPNLLDRYVASSFSRIFLLTLLSGVSIYVIADLGETVHEMMQHEVPRRLLIDYYKYLTLQIFYDIAPVLVLVTTLITFSLLARSNEITALKALGVSLYRVSIPALAVAGLVVALSAFLEAEVLPASNQRVAQIRDRIKGRETARTYRRADRQWLFGHGRYVYNYMHFDPRQEVLQRLQVFEFEESYNLSRRLYTSLARYVGDSDEPKYRGGDWLWSDGWARSFDGARNLRYERFGEVLVDYPETPEYFDTDVVPPDQMAYGELKRYIRDLEESGQSVPDLEVQLHNKIAFPIISLVMALVALPFAFRLGKQGALYGIGISVAVGIIFMGIHAFFTTLGEAGALPAPLAVWSPSLIFALFSLYLFLGVRS